MIDRRGAIELRTTNPATIYPDSFDASLPSHQILIAEDSMMWYSPTPSRRHSAAGAAGNGATSRSTTKTTLSNQQLSVYRNWSILPIRNTFFLQYRRPGLCKPKDNPWTQRLGIFSDRDCAFLSKISWGSWFIANMSLMFHSDATNNCQPLCSIPATTYFLQIKYNRTLNSVVSWGG